MTVPEVVSSLLCQLVAFLPSVQWIPVAHDLPTTCSLQSIMGSTGLLVTTLTLMLYTISLHIAAAAGAFRVGFSWCRGYEFAGAGIII